MAMAMEQVVTQLQHEVFNLRAQVAAESGLADAVRANNNLATAHVRKDTASLIDVKGLGRPKEFTGREEDFQQGSKKTEAFFVEMMLEWAAEPTEIKMTSSCRRLSTRTEECKTWSLCCSRCTQHSWLSRVMRRMTLLPTRGRTHWRHGGDHMSDTIRRQEEENETFCARSFLLDGALFWIERWESYVSRYEKKMKDKLDDEVKLAGLESLVPEELEKHLILNSNRLQTFEDARLEVVTYVEAKFGLIIRDSKPSDTGARGHSDPMDVDAVNPLSPRKGRMQCTQKQGQAIIRQRQSKQDMVQE